MGATGEGCRSGLGRLPWERSEGSSPGALFPSRGDHLGTFLTKIRMISLPLLKVVYVCGK